MVSKKKNIVKFSEIAKETNLWNVEKMNQCIDKIKKNINLSHNDLSSIILSEGVTNSSKKEKYRLFGVSIANNECEYISGFKYKIAIKVKGSYKELVKLCSSIVNIYNTRLHEPEYIKKIKHEFKVLNDKFDSEITHEEKYIPKLTKNTVIQTHNEKINKFKDYKQNLIKYNNLNNMDDIQKIFNEDIKLTNYLNEQQKNKLNSIFDEFIEKKDEFNKSNRKSNFFLDESMIKYNEKNNKNYDGDAELYVLTISNIETLKKLYKNKYMIFNNETRKIIQKYLDEINKNMNDSNNYNVLYQNIDLIIQFFKKRMATTNESYFKSQGEFRCMISLILLSNDIYNLICNLTINTSEIINPKTGKKLEIDFCIHDDNNNIYIAIEIDGEHHEKENQKINDMIKKIFIEADDISFMSIENDDNIYESMYNKINDYVLKNNGKLTITKDNFIKITNYINSKTTFSSFSYAPNIYANINFDDNLCKEYENKNDVDVMMIKNQADNIKLRDMTTCLNIKTFDENIKLQKEKDNNQSIDINEHIENKLQNGENILMDYDKHKNDININNKELKKKQVPKNIKKKSLYQNK